AGHGTPLASWVEHLVSEWRRTHPRHFSTPSQLLRSLEVGRDDRAKSRLPSSPHADVKSCSIVSACRQWDPLQPPPPAPHQLWNRSKSLLLRGSVLHLQVVGYGEDSGHAVRADSGDVLVRLVVDNAFQSHMAAIDDDVNRWNRAHRVAEQGWVVEDRPRR